MSSNDEGRTPGRDDEVEGHGMKFKGVAHEDEGTEGASADEGGQSAAEES